MEQLPPQVQHQVSQMQQAQQQAQALARQKQQMEINLRESERALDELSKMDEDTSLYKSIGGIMIGTNQSEAKEELEDRKETLTLQKKKIERREERVKKQLEELRGKVQDALRNQQISGGSS